MTLGTAFALGVLVGCILITVVAVMAAAADRE